MILLGILAFIVLAAPAVGLAKRMNRPVRSGGNGRGSPTRSGGGKSSGSKGSAGGTSKTTSKTTSGRSGYQRTGGGPSWVLKAWNASGAPKTSETTLKGAAAVVTGKAAGRTARGGAWVSRKFGRGGVWVTKRAFAPAGRWLDRTQAALENAAGKPRPANGRPAETTTVDAGGKPTPVTGGRYGTSTAPGPELYQPGKDPAFDRKLTEFKLATKKKWLAESIEAFEGLVADGLASPDNEEHWRNRRRLQAEIEQLERALNPDYKPEPAASPPPVFVRPKTEGDNHVDTNATTPPLNPQAVPPTLAQHLNWVHDFEPENDADLLNMLAAEVHGMHAYAEATSNMFDHCVTGKGLDPSAMQGVSDYADAFAEAAATVAAAHKQFVAVYDAIIEAANNGVQMPYNGRFFSGESAA